MGCEASRNKSELALPLVERRDATEAVSTISANGVKSYIKPTTWLHNLPLPPPVCVALLIGASAGACAGLVRCIELFIVLSVVSPILYKCAMGYVSVAVKDYIELVDRDHIGVDIHIGKLDISLCSGRALIHDLKIDNPEGYSSEHLFKAKRISIDVDVAELIASKMQHIVIEVLELNNIDAVIEYKSVVFGHGPSNLQTVLDFMGKSKTTKKPILEDGSKPTLTADPALVSEDKPAKKKRDITLQKVEFVDVGAQMVTSFNMTTIARTHLACADMRYKDFEAETSSKGLDVIELVAILLKSIMKSVMVNIAAFKLPGGLV